MEGGTRATSGGEGTLHARGGGPGRFGGSQATNIRPDQFERDESYGRGRSYSGEGGESFRGYGVGAGPSRPINNKRNFDDRERMEKEEQDLRAMLRREQDDRRQTDDARRLRTTDDRESRGKSSGALADYHCFNCDGTRHMRKDCTNPPFCYCCKKSGHRSLVCPEKRGLRLCGFGIPGQGFYSMHIPSDRSSKNKREVMGIMVIEKGDADVSTIEKELRHFLVKCRNGPSGK
jgi:hypothetical protein